MPPPNIGRAPSVSNPLSRSDSFKGPAQTNTKPTGTPQTNVQQANVQQTKAPERTRGDGFQTVSNNEPQRGGAQPKKGELPTEMKEALNPGLMGWAQGKAATNVSADFKKDPMAFTSNVLNVNNAMPLIPPKGLSLPTDGKPFVPASDSTVTVSAYQHNHGSKTPGNANMVFHEAGGEGAQAYYLHYLSKGTGTFAGISGVPKNPTTGPKTIVTGQLNGCAVHAFHDKNTDTMSFVHHADFSNGGEAELKKFMKDRPQLEHLSTVGPKDYSHPLAGGKGMESGATLFAQYNEGTKQWNMVTQLNQQKPAQPGDKRPVLEHAQFPAPTGQGQAESTHSSTNMMLFPIKAPESSKSGSASPSPRTE